MSASGLVRLGCRSCGAPLPASVSWPCVLECPSCSTPLIVSSADTPPRSVVFPTITLAQAIERARESWQHELAPAGFPGRAEAPRLIFLACYEVERCLAARGIRAFVTELRSRTLAVLPEGLGVERLDLEAALDHPDRRTYDPREVQSLGLVFDPVRSLDIVLPVPPGLKLLEQRVEIVFVPIWVVRCRHRGQRYEAVIDATVGRLLSARAPVERSARLGTAVLMLYPVAAIAGIPLREWPLIGAIAIRTPLLSIWGVGALALVLGWAWDRVRFRYDWVEDPSGARLEALNRPERTWFERLSGLLLRLPPRIKRAKRGA